MKMILIFVKKWVPSVITVLMSIFLLYVAQDYPCLRGAGLALADMEAFIFLVLIGLPCLIWAISKLLVRAGSVEQLNLEDRWIRRIAFVVIAFVMLFAFLAIPTIFSFKQQPLHFICR